MARVKLRFIMRCPGFKSILKAAIGKNAYYKKFVNAKFRDDVNNFAFNQFDVGNFKKTVFNIFDKHAPIKQIFFQASEAAFMTKELHR